VLLGMVEETIAIIRSSVPGKSTFCFRLSVSSTQASLIMKVNLLITTHSQRHMFRSKERTGLYTMEGELAATYGVFYQPLRCWSEVYKDYIRREALEGYLPSQLLADIDIMRTQPMMSEIELIAWTLSDFNMDMIVRSKTQYTSFLPEWAFSSRRN
jgi:hypothetical protein